MTRSRSLAALLAVAVPLALAGCVSEAGDAIGPASLGDGVAPATAFQVIPVDETGATGRAVAACAPTGCRGVGLGGTAVFEVALDGTLDEADLTLTWDATGPLTEELLVGIGYETADGMEYVYEYGASPLVLSKAGLGIEAASVLLYVNAFKCVGGPAAGCVSTEQPFALQGTLGVAPAP